jgi:FlaA1/EpsC-like NDP-sugar epimerase
MEVDHDLLRVAVAGRRVMVTGAAGSIGSELCRQLVRLGCESLVLYDRAESALYYTDIELRRAGGDARIEPVVGDIGDGAHVNEVIGRHRPEIVYHAAAYKHVPLMQRFPLEAIRNNVLATRVVAEAARAGGVKSFVFVSTDKAATPVGIMAQTKRVAESLVCSYDKSPTAFMAVRFGNVLGSNGSVVPLFQWQIANGGPVTVTHVDAARYFMLVAEAAHLILQAGAMGRGGEVFFLDMGEPIRVMDLARDLVRRAGRNVTLQTIGLRPGESLHEQLTSDSEDVFASEHDRILVRRARALDPDDLTRDLEELAGLVAIRAEDAAMELLAALAARY